MPGTNKPRAHSKDGDAPRGGRHAGSSMHEKDLDEDPLPSDVQGEQRAHERIQDRETREDLT